MEATSSPSTGGDDPTRMQFPMYVMRMKDFLALDLMIPHGTLVDQGLCVPYDAASHGPVNFVSHQWLSSTHPDPDAIQLKCVQHMFRQVIDNDKREEPGDGEDGGDGAYAPFKTKVGRDCDVWLPSTGGNTLFHNGTCLLRVQPVHPPYRHVHPSLTPLSLTHPLITHPLMRWPQRHQHQHRILVLGRLGPLQQAVGLHIASRP